MKLIVVLTFAFTLSVTAEGIAQKLSVSVKNVTLKQLFNQVTKQTGYVFFYTDEVLQQSKKVSVNVKNASIEQLLDICFQDQPLTYSIVNKTVVIRQKAAIQTPVVASTQAPAFLPPVEVRGRVINDKTGEPVVGANVVIKGQRRGTSTDKEGNFVIAAETGNALVISFVGFEQREIPVPSNPSGSLVIRLAITTRSMNDLVVTGLYNRPKENFTGASSSFTSEDLQKVTNTNVLSAIRALDPSFQLPENINIGSNPNALPDIVIRGGNSLTDVGQANNPNPFNYVNGANIPLFILDGFEVPLQRINDLDMNRITKVDILKDAAATAIYGSRAANGVIVIETIRPRDGKLRFTYNANVIAETPDLTGYNLINAAEKLEIERKSGIYLSTFNTTQNNLNYIYNARLAEVRRGVNTDWLSQPVRTGIGTKHNIYLEGGGNAALYGVNVTYDQRSGVMKGSDRRTMSGNTFLSYRVKNFQFRNDLTLNFNKANNSPYGSFTQYSRLNPYWTPRDSAGNMKIYLEDIRDPAGNRLTNFDLYDNLDGQAAGRAVNPLYNAGLNITDQSTYQNFVNNFFIQWQAATWLKFGGRFAYQRQSDESDRFLPAQHTSFVSKPTFEKGTYTKGYGKRTSMEGMITADVNKLLGQHLFFGTVGMNLQETRFNTESFTVQGFPNPRLDQLVLGNRFPEGSRPTGTESISRLAGFLSNLSYSYNSRYLVDLSYRLDGSSQFGVNKRFAPFWSAGVGWNLHKENLFRDLRYINRLKLRYSFGYTGSQNFPSYLGITTSRYYTNQEYRGVISTSLLGYGNENLAWQKTQKNNFGADITLFDRVDITGNYFVEKTQGSIATISTPPSVGFLSYKENLGDVVSRGWELNTRVHLMTSQQRRDNWSVFANLFHVTSKIQKVSNTIAALNKTADTSRSTRPLIRYSEGQSTTAIWAVRSLGIDPASGEEIFLSRDGKIVGTYSPLNQVVVGDNRPKIESTFGTNFEKSGLGLNVIFRLRYGGQAYNQTLIERVENVNVRYYNVDRRVAEERWLKPGDITFYKGLLDAQGALITSPTFATSRFVQDDNLLSCESLSVFYRLPEVLNKRLSVENTKFTFYTNELFRFSSIRRERGLDYPFSRSFTLQLQTTF